MPGALSNPVYIPNISVASAMQNLPLLGAYLIPVIAWKPIL